MIYLKTQVRKNGRDEFSMYLIPEHEIASIHVELNKNGAGFITAEVKSDNSWCPTIAHPDGQKKWDEALAECFIEI